MKDREIDKKPTMQVLIDAGWHKILAHKRVDLHKSIRRLVEDALINTYSDEVTETSKDQ